MFRFILLYLSRAEWARRLVMNWRLARRVVLRFVAGETRQDAIETIQKINARGMTVTVDILGESVTDASEARQTVTNYLDLIEDIREHRLDAWMSLKLTALGLDIDQAMCYQNMRDILLEARAHNIQVTIDMEDHPYTQKTLDLFNQLRHEEDFDNLRTVIQSYLYRSHDDIDAMAESCAGIRLCKGAYKEPPDIAYPKKADVDAAYVSEIKVLLDAAADGCGYPGVATHDENLINIVKAYAAENDISPDAYEFQMLYGVRSALQKQLVEEGYRMRVYVPFGSQWYPYFMRRLAERPANLWFFASNLVRR